MKAKKKDFQLQNFGVWAGLASKLRERAEVLFTRVRQGPTHSVPTTNFPLRARFVGFRVFTEMKRMNSPARDIDISDDASVANMTDGIRLNPMFQPSDTSDDGPSSAYMESMRRARESGAWDDARISSPRVSKAPGTKTKLVIIFFCLVGFCLFVSGATIYWNGDYGEDKRKTGLDLLVCSALPLLPGVYGAVMWAGSAQGWSGYSMVRMNFDDVY
jgi:hypothetical protein